MALFAHGAINILRSIVSRSPTAKKELNDLRRNYSFDISTEFSFTFYGKRDWSDFCECWFINEYFEYITGSEINITQFDTVLENIARGRCTHVSQYQTKNTLQSSVSLIHVATAAGSKAVVKYLINADNNLKNRRTGIGGLLPLVLTILKDRHGLIKYVSYRDRHLYGNGMLLAKRKTDENGGGIDVIVPKNVTGAYAFVLSFFLNAVPSRKTISKLDPVKSDYAVTQVLRYVIYEHERKTCADIVDNFAANVRYFRFDLILEAIIWNKPEALKTIIEKGIGNEYARDLSSNDLYVCRILGHVECLEIIHHFGAKKLRITPVTSTISPYSYLIMFYSRHCFYCHVERFFPLFRIIAQKGCDINQTDKNGMAPAHYATEYVSNANGSSAIINCLCQMGCDINSRDVNGRTPLFISLTPFDSPLGIPNSRNGVSRSLRIVKDLLYYNAVPKCTPMAIFYAIECDKTNKLLDYVHDNTVSVMMRETDQKGTETDIYAETTDEKYLALSFVAILLELGFQVGHSEGQSLSRLSGQLGKYVHIMMAVPKCLKVICRNVIRSTFPGQQLKQYLDGSHIPESIGNFILAKPYLLRTVIVSDTGRYPSRHMSRIDVSISTSCARWEC